MERQMVVSITAGVDLVQLVVSAVSALAAVASVWVALYISHRSKWPDVVAYLEADLDSGTTDLVVRNIGDSPAYDVRVGFGVDYTLVQPVFQKGASGSFVRTGIPMLVPGSERRTTVFENGWGSEHATDTCEVDVSFGRKGVLGGMRRMSARCVLEYRSYANAVHRHSLEKQAVDALVEIASYLRSR